MILHIISGYNLEFCYSARRGRLADVRHFIYRSPSSVRKVREASLPVKGAKLFNSIPRDLRDQSYGSVDSFKHGLDMWLASIPDEPPIPNYPRAAITNSLLDQIPLQNNTFSYY